MASTFKRYDIVLLPDDSEGRIMAIVDTGSIKVCKVKRGDHVDYFDESKLRLKRRSFLNYIFTLFKF